ncbi:Kdo hydroxylase family protein, partial [Chromobacterium sphagni]
MGERIVSVAGGERALVQKLEAGAVLHVPDFGFTLSAAEQALLDPALSDPKRKNISLEPGNGALHGVLGGADKERAVRALISRYQRAAADLLAQVLPEYQGKVRPAPTSLRLVRVEDRKTSWRKDDSRLHVDAFPSRPTYGER